MRRLLSLLLAGCLCTSACSSSSDGESDEPPAPESTTTQVTTRSPAQRLGLAKGWGPSDVELDRAARIVRRLKLPDLAGQVIVAHWSGTKAPVRMVRDLNLGGVIAFDANVVSAAQIRGLNAALRKQVPRDWPLFIGVDQEGGAVERLRGAATRFPAFMSAGAAANAALTQSTYAAQAAELRGLGFTVNFAPVADVTVGSRDPAIGARSVSTDPLAVAEHVTAAGLGLLESGIVPVLKHFPGHGSVPQDSHLTLPVQTRSLAELERIDLVPFALADSAGLPAVMVGHIDVRAIDPGTPASLSRRVITGTLRKELGFSGLVVTDSLKMAAVTRGRTPSHTAVAAIRAGADVLLMPPSPRAARGALIDAVRRGKLPRRRLEQAAARQIALLAHLEGTKFDPAGTPRQASQDFSAAALTVASGPCSGALVRDSVYPFGDPDSVATFGAAADAAGLTVLRPGTPPRRLAVAKPRPHKRKGEWRRHFRDRRKRWQRHERTRIERLDRWHAREQVRLDSGTAIAFVGYRDAALDADIVVATDSPWVLARVSAPIRIATYASTPGAMEALVEVLAGKQSAPGRLPVRVANVERQGC